MIVAMESEGGKGDETGVTEGERMIGKLNRINVDNKKGNVQQSNTVGRDRVT